MENNEFMNEMMTEELQEVTEKAIENSKSSVGLIAVAGIGLAALVGGIAYKCVVKPFLAKRKAIDVDAISEEESDQNNLEGIDESEFVNQEEIDKNDEQ